MPCTSFSVPEKYVYQNGFESYHETEAIPGALPIGQNSPQQPPFGLYAEKLSGTAFTAPRHENLQTWLYRILPAAAHSSFEPCVSSGSSALDSTKPDSPEVKLQQIPNQLRWNPFDLDVSKTWVESLNLVCGSGSPTIKIGLGILIFAVGKDMTAKQAFYSSDGDFLIVVQHGVLEIQTELGFILARPNEIVVIPRGIRYRVSLPSGPARGYVLELYQGHFQLPELGPIGSNGLANSRDFQAPVAAFEDTTKGVHNGLPSDSDISSETSDYTLVTKFDGQLFQARQKSTPFDVVAWHGRYYPYKYDLGRFNVIGSISFDHPDPSIYTVLTGPSNQVGTAIADFVIFPPRWLVQEDTFRPPWYHRNTMSEFMGLIYGSYDAKEDGGFKPAGASLHNVMSAHGPDSDAYATAIKADLKPVKVGQESMAFMFESSLMLGVTKWGLQTCQKIQPHYNRSSWQTLKANFVPPEGVLLKSNKIRKGA